MTWADRRAVGQDASVRAQRAWWDREAAGFYAEHGAFLGDADFVWGPEGWTEAELGLLASGGGVPPGPVLEIGGGAGQCGRWLRAQGALVITSDLSGGMTRQARSVNASTGSDLPVVQCDAGALPFADGAFGTVFTAYGVIPFVADLALVVAEVARVLHPGGRFAYSTSHPIRWAFPDVPGEAGLTASLSYFDMRPYAECDDAGEVTYVEHHRLLQDHVAAVIEAGLTLRRVVEPPWPGRNRQTWGGWSPLRGAAIPGTLVVIAEKPIAALGG